MRAGPFVTEPSHILGKLLAIAAGDECSFSIFGIDWPTRDGTAMRDYVHVWDLALAHVAILENFDSVFANIDEMFNVINLGSGTGVTVKDFVSAFQKKLVKPLNISNAPRRVGDSVGAFANCDKANRLFGWKAIYGIEDGIYDALAWTEHFRVSKHSTHELLYR